MEAKEPLAASDVKSWKKEALPHPVEFPSGNVALVRRRPLEAFWKAGKIPNTLLPIVEKALQTGSMPKMKESDWSPEQLSDLLQMMDIVTMECVVEPKIYPAPPEGEDRDDDKLYIDEVQIDDKAFAYQYAIGAASDAESFRKQSSRRVESTSTRRKVQSKTKPAA